MWGLSWSCIVYKDVKLREDLEKHKSFLLLSDCVESFVPCFFFGGGEGSNHCLPPPSLLNPSYLIRIRTPYPPFLSPLRVEIIQYFQGYHIHFFFFYFLYPFPFSPLPFHLPILAIFFLAHFRLRCSTLDVYHHHHHHHDLLLLLPNRSPAVKRCCTRSTLAE